MGVIRRIRRADHVLSVRIAARGTRWSARWGNLVSRADAVPIWLATAAGLAATGPRGRRAAVHGLVAYQLGSSTNRIVKGRVRRTRPRAPVPHRSGTKSTYSFPSGHASSGTGFVTAAGLAWPAVAPPLAVLEVAVATSRVDRREHYVGDILAGMVIGVTAGVVVHTLARRLHEEPDHRPRPDRTGQPAARYRSDRSPATSVSVPSSTS